MSAEDPAPRAADDPTRAQLRGSTLLLAGQAFALVVNLAVQVLIVRVLTKADYGAFAFALSIVLLGEAVAGFGLRRGVSRYVPIFEERGEDGKAAGTLVFAAATVLSLGTAAALVIIGLRHAITGSFPAGTEAATVLVLMSALVPLQATSNLLDGVFAIYTRPRAIVLRKFVITPLMRLAVVALLALGSSDVELLAAGYVATGLTGLAIYGALLVPLLGERGVWRRLRRGRLSVPVRELLGFTVPLLTNDVTHAMLSAGSAVLLGVLATAGDVAELRAVIPVSMTMTYVLSSFSLLFVPLAARMYARGDSAGLNRLYWQTATWTTVLSYPVFIVSVGLAEPLTVLLFGERYASAAPLLAVLALGHFVTAAAGPNGVLLGVFGRVRYIVGMNVAAAAGSLALSLLLIPRLDALGAALATSITFVGLNAGLQLGLARHTDVLAVDRSSAVVYGSVAVVSAAALPLLLLASLPAGADIALTALAALAVLALARRRLDLAEAFPELARVPGLRLLLATGTRR
ncbi:MAG: oligosaccharide flippase family protein [Solirubrobacteraceae bacterium]